MRLIIFTTLFLIPLIGFASFPIQMSIPSNTIIESKKETMEEYKMRSQKQLYKPTEKKYKKSIKENIKPRSFVTEILFMALGIIIFLRGNYISYNASSIGDGYLEMALGVASFVIGILILLVKSIKRKIKKAKKRRGSLNLN